MATYKIKSSYSTGSYANVTITPDPVNTLFQIGDTVTVSGTVYNAKSAPVTNILVMLNNSGQGGIEVDIKKGKTASFTKTLTIRHYHVSSNAVVGANANALFEIRLDYDTVSEFDDLSIVESDAVGGNVLRFKIKDDTVAPVFSITDVQFTDKNKHLERFGQYVQSKSACEVYLPLDQITVDPDGQPSGTVEYVALEIRNEAGDKVFSAKKLRPKVPFDVGEIFTTPGGYTFLITVTGEYGKSNTGSMGLTVLPYTKPALSAIGSDPVVLRYKKGVDDYGETIYTPDMTGTLALFKFDGGIAHLNGKNTWSLSLDYDLANADVAAVSSGGVIASGTESKSIGYDYLDTLGFIPAEPLPVEFSPANRYRFTFTLTDYFGETAVLTGYADKATGLFNVTKNGVAVGMITTGEPGKKKFEVNENYESHFYGGIHGVTNYSDGEIATGGRWRDNKPVYRKTVMLPSVSKGSTSTTTRAVISQDIEHVIGFYGMMQATDGIWYPLNFRSVSSSAYVVDCYVKSDGGVVLRTGSSTALSGGYMVCLYTKKSDDPIESDDGTAALIDSGGVAVADAGGTPYVARANNTDQYISAYTGAQIDAGIAKAYDALLRSGGTMEGMLTLFADPVGAMDAVTRQFMEAAIRQIELTPGPKGDTGVGIVSITIREVGETDEPDTPVEPDVPVDPDGTHIAFTDSEGKLFIDANNNSFMTEV